MVSLHFIFVKLFDHLKQPIPVKLCALCCFRGLSHTSETFVIFKLFEDKQQTVILNRIFRKFKFSFKRNFLANCFKFINVSESVIKKLWS